MIQWIIAVVLALAIFEPRHLMPQSDFCHHLDSRLALDLIAVVDSAKQAVGFDEIDMTDEEEKTAFPVMMVVVDVGGLESVPWRRGSSSVVLQLLSYPEECNECHSSFQP